VGEARLPLEPGPEPPFSTCDYVILVAHGKDAAPYLSLDGPTSDPEPPAPYAKIKGSAVPRHSGTIRRVLDTAG
jgi:hypothetical protein